jgi:hypothetical protein
VVAARAIVRIIYLYGYMMSSPVCTESARDPHRIAKAGS